MDGDRVDAVTEWETVSVERGHRGLRDLADRGFSGAVTDGRAWALLTNGRVVGVTDGDVDDFADADLTAYSAPDPALPLLFAMQEGGGETRARYYTNDTPVSAAHETLSAGGFTGYIELSENVLSGDYYVVYYGGEAMPVAFIGNNRRLLTGDEAFERADDEVGIYEVYEADVEVVEVPGGDRDGEDATAAAGVGADADGAPEPTDGSEPSESEDVVVASEPDARDDGDDGDDDAAGDADAGEPVEGGGEGTASAAGRDRGGDADATDAAATTAADDGGTAAEATDDATPAASDDEDDGVADAGSDWPTPELAREPADEPSATDASGPSEATDGEAPEPDEAAEAAEATDADGTTEPAETTDAESAASRGEEPGPATEAGDDGATLDRAPTLDADSTTARGTGQSADATEAPATPDEGGDAATPDEGGDERGAGEADTGQTASDAETEGTPDAEDGSSEPSAAADDRVETLEVELAETRERLATVRTERDDLREEVEGLRERVAELERELEEARATAGASGDGEALSPDAALAGTNLFVRYRSKAEATLADARDEGADPDAVNDNLRIEHHTAFEAEGATVEGRPFAEFLESSVAYRFVRWLVRELPYELRGVDSRGGLGKLFEAIPSFDRVELDGTVEGEAEEWSFDVVVRDRHGAPLVVADVFDARDPTDEATLASLIEAAKAACAENESVGGAMLVTTSYFAPEALELADGETAGGGLFGRGSRESYVRLDRNRGFHLCLVEARDGDYHLSVPDL
ncbi:MAG: hypothetical protein ABEJ61_06685 [Haloferacaceae archaeon]